jgi:HK97 gp10 family phage protein
VGALANGHEYVIDEVAVHSMLTGRDGPVFRELERRCIKAQAIATRLCPVDTGRLQASIDFVIFQAGAVVRAPSVEGGDLFIQLNDGGEALVAYIGSIVEYAIYVEFGTYKMAAQPYLRPAVERTAA